MGNTVDIQLPFCVITLSMDEDYNVAILNNNFPHLGKSNYSDNCFPKQMIGIIDQLENTPGKLDSNRTMWEEINFVVSSTFALLPNR